MLAIVMLDRLKGKFLWVTTESCAPLMVTLIWIRLNRSEEALLTALPFGIPLPTDPAEEAFIMNDLMLQSLPSLAGEG